MIPANTQIWLVAGVTDLRRGFTGLSAFVQTKLEQNPLMDPVTLSTIVKGCLTHIEHLEFIIAQMQRREFGRRSEKAHIG